MRIRVLIKKALKTILVLALFFVVVSKGLEVWLEKNFEAKFNANPKRAYNVIYKNLDLDYFFTGVTLEEVKIEPLNAGIASVVTAQVDYATLNGLVWIKLLFFKELDMQEITFVNPVFKVEIVKSSEGKKGGKGLQTLFGDILSRAHLKNFRLKNGSVVLSDMETKDTIGKVENINILATELKTDAVQLNNLIPFQMGNIHIDIKKMAFKLNEYTFLNLGGFKYNLKNKEILLKNVKLGYNKSWVAVSREKGFQNDIVEFDAKEIGIHKLEPTSEFYNNLDIDAKSVTIDELNIKLQRNKKLPRPKNTIKPMFQDMVNAIPVNLKVDSISIYNSSLSYGELGLNKSKTGYVVLGDLNGFITGITNKRDHQENIGSLHVNLSATLENKASLNLDLSAPYGKKSFRADVKVDDMKFSDFNNTLKPLIGVEMLSGQIKRIQYHMEADSVWSKNHLIFDYKDLNISVLKEQDEDGPRRKIFESAMANVAINSSNMPGDENYKSAKYKYKRNIYRSPINYLIHGLIEGFTYIIPKKKVQKFLRKKKKDEIG